MASCGPAPSRATATFVQQQQQTCCCNTRSVLLQCTLLQHPLSSKYYASTSSDILAAASHATAAAVLISGSTSTPMKVNVVATFGDNMSPVSAYFTNLHRPLRTWDEPGQERLGACVAETERSVVCTPTTVPRLIRNLHKASYYSIHPRRFARNASYERSCFWRITTRAQPKKSYL